MQAAFQQITDVMWTKINALQSKDASKVMSFVNGRATKFSGKLFLEISRFSIFSSKREKNLENRDPGKFVIIK